MSDGLDARIRELEGDMREVMAWKDVVDSDLYNHGQDGLKTRLTKFMAEQEKEKELRKEIEKEQEERQNERHRQNRERMNVAIGLLLVIAAWLTLVQPFIKH